jgi:hypothetical protein
MTHSKNGCGKRARRGREVSDDVLRISSRSRRRNCSQGLRPAMSGGRRLVAAVGGRWLACAVLGAAAGTLSSRVPAGVEVVPGDVLDAASLSPAMQGVEAAYYLVHSMGATGDFENRTAWRQIISPPPPPLLGRAADHLSGRPGRGRAGVVGAPAQPARGGGAAAGARRAGDRVPGLHHHRLGQPCPLK